MYAGRNKNNNWNLIWRIPEWNRFHARQTNRCRGVHYEVTPVEWNSPSETTINHILVELLQI